MDESKSSPLQKDILEFARRLRDSELSRAVEALDPAFWEQEAKFAEHADGQCKTILARLNGTDSSLFKRFADKIALSVLAQVPDAELKEALASSLQKFCQKRIEKGDLTAVEIVHTSLIEEPVFRGDAFDCASDCLEYFVALWGGLTRSCDYDDLDIFFRRAVDFSTRVNGAKHRTTADALDFMAMGLRSKGEHEGACDLVWQAIEIFEKLPDCEDDLLDNLLMFAEFAVDGHLTERNFFMSERTNQVIERARSIIDGASERAESYEAVRLNRLLGIKYHNEHDDEMAIDSCKQALAICRKLDGNPLTQRRLLLWLSRIYADRNEPALVEECYTEALSFEPPRSHADELADDLYCIAEFYIRRAQFAKAEELLEQALSLKMQARVHPFTAVDVLEKELGMVRRLRQEQEDRKERPLPGILGEIEEMVGLEEVKKALREHGVYMDFLRLRKERGFAGDEKPVLHAVFTGNPGTGKTTVAKLLGQIYHRLGLLSSGHVHTVERADLVGTTYGASETLTKKALEDAKGGVLFIDEAYSLTRHYLMGEVDERDPGQHVIETLLSAMTDPKCDMAIVVAGYPKEVEQFLSSNPGLRSRFKLHFHFADYTPPEMIEIAKRAARKHDIVLSEDARMLLAEIFEKAYQDRNKFFGNARYVISLIDDCKRALGLRIMANTNPRGFSNAELSLVTRADVNAALVSHQAITYRSPLNERLIEKTLAELDALTGLRNVKEFVHELIKVVRVYRQHGKDVLSAFKLHAAFTGNPGTGKTTVARIIADLYRALGILEKGHLVECDRSTLVGQYIGETEQKTKAKIEEAIGGVLFIDEAYALLGHQSGWDFGRRTIEILLKEMEDRRGQFFVILAGYKEEMKQLLDMNPGLRSRVDRVVEFEDYNGKELLEIASDMLTRHELFIDPQDMEALHKKLDALSLLNGFANARTVRSLIEQLVIKHFASLADLPSEERTASVLSTVDIKLLEQIELGQLVVPRRPVGF